MMEFIADDMGNFLYISKVEDNVVYGRWYNANTERLAILQVHSVTINEHCIVRFEL